MTAEQEQLFEALRVSLWGEEKKSGPIPEAVRAELRSQTVESLTALAYPDQANQKYFLAAQFTWMARAQEDAVRLLQDAGIPVVVIKGTASGIYYPQPYLRTYGDIDLLVQPENYSKAIWILSSNGWTQEGDVGDSHTALHKDNFLLELHQSPPGLERVREGDYILTYLRSGFQDIQTGSIGQPKCAFPMLPWKQNGLELIWHFREHLYNGIGLRHAIDWMMFVNAKLHTEEAFAEYRPVLEKVGLLTLAKSVTRMCQMYLGLDSSISWCADVDVDVCADLMDFILDQGNFGHKRTDDKAAKVMSRYRTPLAFLKGLQRKGLSEWGSVKKHPALRPFAWTYSLRVGSRRYLRKGGLQQLRKDRAENRRRQGMFDQLYGEKVISEQISRPHAVPVSAAKGKPPLKQRLRPMYERIARSPLRVPLYYLEKLYFAVRYPLYGKPKISDADREEVEQNVTFIYKSFNRQKLARRCYKVIKAYYPKARVVIADDSEEPLKIADLAEGDLILHLPFNSGLSKGLIAALAEVKTPFTMRMDDDLLLTPATKIHEQLRFLEKHDEVDLAAVQMGHRRPEKRAAEYRQVHMRKRLIIPSGTCIDGREVVYKAPNVYLARTLALQKVGYDPKIRMIDHHEFFYRAAGEIVCVQDPHAYVMHCHNHFEKKKYATYRGDYSGDAAYIAKKHGSKYR